MKDILILSKRLADQQKIMIKKDFQSVQQVHPRVPTSGESVVFTDEEEEKLDISNEFILEPSEIKNELKGLTIENNLGSE